MLLNLVQRDGRHFIDATVIANTAQNVDDTILSQYLRCECLYVNPNVRHRVVKVIKARMMTETGFVGLETLLCAVQCISTQNHTNDCSALASIISYRVLQVLLTLKEQLQVRVGSEDRMRYSGPVAIPMREIARIPWLAAVCADTSAVSAPLSAILNTSVAEIQERAHDGSIAQHLQDVTADFARLFCSCEPTAVLEALRTVRSEHSCNTYRILSLLFRLSVALTMVRSGHVTSTQAFPVMGACLSELLAETCTILLGELYAQYHSANDASLRSTSQSAAAATSVDQGDISKTYLFQGTWLQDALFDIVRCLQGDPEAVRQLCLYIALQSSKRSHTAAVPVWLSRLAWKRLHTGSHIVINLALSWPVYPALLLPMGCLSCLLSTAMKNDLRLYIEQCCNIGVTNPQPAAHFSSWYQVLHGTHPWWSVDPEGAFRLLLDSCSAVDEIWADKETQAPRCWKLLSKLLHRAAQLMRLSCGGALDAAYCHHSQDLKMAEDRSSGTAEQRTEGSSSELLNGEEMQQLWQKEPWRILRAGLMLQSISAVREEISYNQLAQWWREEFHQRTLSALQLAADATALAQLDASQWGYGARRRWVSLLELAATNAPSRQESGIAPRLLLESIQTLIRSLSLAAAPSAEASTAAVGEATTVVNFSWSAVESMRTAVINAADPPAQLMQLLNSSACMSMSVGTSTECDRGVEWMSVNALCGCAVATSPPTNDLARLALSYMHRSSGLFPAIMCKSDESRTNVSRRFRPLHFTADETVRYNRRAGLNDPSSELVSAAQLAAALTEFENRAELNALPRPDLLDCTYSIVHAVFSTLTSANSDNSNTAGHALQPDTAIKVDPVVLEVVSAHRHLVVVPLLAGLFNEHMLRLLSLPEHELKASVHAGYLTAVIEVVMCLGLPTSALLPFVATAFNSQAERHIWRTLLTDARNVVATLVPILHRLTGVLQWTELPSSAGVALVRFLSIMYAVGDIGAQLTVGSVFQRQQCSYLVAFVADVWASAFSATATQLECSSTAADRAAEYLFHRGDGLVGVSVDGKVQMVHAQQCGVPGSDDLAVVVPSLGYLLTMLRQGGDAREATRAAADQKEACDLVQDVVGVVGQIRDGKVDQAMLLPMQLIGRYHRIDSSSANISALLGTVAQSAVMRETAGLHLLAALSLQASGDPQHLFYALAECGQGIVTELGSQPSQQQLASAQEKWWRTLGIAGICRPEAVMQELRARWGCADKASMGAIAEKELAAVVTVVRTAHQLRVPIPPELRRLLLVVFAEILPHISALPAEPTAASGSAHGSRNAYSLVKYLIRTNDNPNATLLAQVQCARLGLSVASVAGGAGVRCLQELVEGSDELRQLETRTLVALRDARNGTKLERHPVSTRIELSSQESPDVKHRHREQGITQVTKRDDPGLLKRSLVGVQNTESSDKKARHTATASTPPPKQSSTASEERRRDVTFDSPPAPLATGKAETSSQESTPSRAAESSSAVSTEGAAVSPVPQSTVTAVAPTPIITSPGDCPTASKAYITSPGDGSSKGSAVLGGSRKFKGF